MPARIVEVAQDGRHLSLHRGFLHIGASAQSAAAQVPIDDLAALIANAHGLSYTNPLLVALAARGIPVVLCGDNHQPCGVVWPVDGHHEQSRRIDAQLQARAPLRKRLWQAVVKAKIAQQAGALRALGRPSAPLSALIARVRSGDAGNIEAQAAQRYWPLLMGRGFVRDRQADGVNALLNYGYMVLRAATARAVIAAGLHPGLGLHHRHAGNAMRLVDDLMEPFRPLIDLQVVVLVQQGHPGVDAHTKRRLAESLYLDVETPEGRSPALLCVQALATSLAQVYLGEAPELRLPPLLLPPAQTN